ncbi:CinA family protein [Flavobacterium sp. UGB4466]|uniref:CinA family protein n=1 Tax=Flavobacterium sp. UGB4466 TaxID=2730889 RepID=UPI00192B2DB0|nr:CinA family protein [Flavobacterium sp. UGB4466]
MTEEEILAFNIKLKDKKLTIVCAESITAGLLASSIASVSGASSILKGSVVTYDRELKSGILKVNPATIDLYSAESMETTVEMAYGLIKVYPSADLYVAVTGIASPGTIDYPITGEVGDVYIVIYYKREESAKRLNQFKIQIKKPKRNDIREEAVREILKKIIAIIE